MVWEDQRREREFKYTCGFVSSAKSAGKTHISSSGTTSFRLSLLNQGFGSPLEFSLFDNFFLEV
jgi:hypothetical protein